MPSKIRELKADLRRAGFVERPGRGSHTGWRHPLLAEKLTLAGNDGDDAKPYQERQVRAVLAKLREMQQEQP
ncbi:MAG TPA: type II toxin-antitoxin system HicA family toxin [Thermomicrobiales bacterium]|nr:type II toxin-antitoxin system HicA family toxin [Thermomicrobiales bacterium]